MAAPPVQQQGVLAHCDTTQCTVLCSDGISPVRGTVQPNSLGPHVALVCYGEIARTNWLDDMFTEGWAPTPRWYWYR